MSIDVEPAQRQGLDQRIRVEGDSVVSTPRVRSTARRLSFWIGTLVALLVLATVILLISGSGDAGATLSGTNPAAMGSKALIQVLRADGVSVSTPRTLKAALAATDTGDTLAIYDENDLLTPTKLERLRGAAGTIVLIEPSFRILRTLAPAVELAGVGDSSFPATESSSCSFGPVKRAGTVSGYASSYRVPTASDAVQTCLSDGDGAYSLVSVESGSTTTIVFGISSALTNQNIVNDGNAALALGLFGSTPHLTWYLPSVADVTVSAADRPVPLPGWVLPTELLAVIVALTAAFWRGRRFGPLVIERMPVVVRASETMEGRARLYQKASSREHALDSLRIGTIGRLAVLCGLPTLATVDEVIGAVIAATGTDARGVRALLVDENPGTDAQLLALSDQLNELEDEVTRATRPT